MSPDGRRAPSSSRTSPPPTTSRRWRSPRPAGGSGGERTPSRRSIPRRRSSRRHGSRPDPMIPRYSRPEMRRVWEDDSKYRRWLEVELAVVDAWADVGRVPKESARLIRERAGFDLKRIQEIEAVVQHDVIAFLTSVAET